MAMDWMEQRLKELPGHKNKAGAAKAIGKPASRISEIVKGKRAIQQDEWAPLAKYLEWGVEDLMKAARRIPDSGDDKVVALPSRPLLMSRTARQSQVVTRLKPESDVNQTIVPVRATRELTDGGGGFVLTQRVIDEYSVPGQGAQSYSFYIMTDDAHPYERGDRVLANPDLPVTKGKKVVLLTDPDEKGEEHGLIRTLVEISPTTWTVQCFVQKGGNFILKTSELSRKDWPHAHVIVGVRHS
jgi:hypothetical protein